MDKIKYQIISEKKTQVLYIWSSLGKQFPKWIKKYGLILQHSFPWLILSKDIEEDGSQKELNLESEK